jgi:hypothetical protein
MLGNASRGKSGQSLEGTAPFRVTVYPVGLYAAFKECGDNRRTDIVIQLRETAIYKGVTLIDVTE